MTQAVLDSTLNIQQTINGTDANLEAQAALAVKNLISEVFAPRVLQAA